MISMSSSSMSLHNKKNQHQSRCRGVAGVAVVGGSRHDDDGATSQRPLSRRRRVEHVVLLVCLFLLYCANYKDTNNHVSVSAAFYSPLPCSLCGEKMGQESCQPPRHRYYYYTSPSHQQQQQQQQTLFARPEGIMAGKLLHGRRGKITTRRRKIGSKAQIDNHPYELTLPTSSYPDSLWLAHQQNPARAFSSSPTALYMSLLPPSMSSPEEPEQNRPSLVHHHHHDSTNDDDIQKVGDSSNMTLETTAVTTNATTTTTTTPSTATQVTLVDAAATMTTKATITANAAAAPLKPLEKDLSLSLWTITDILKRLDAANVRYSPTASRHELETLVIRLSKQQQPQQQYQETKHPLEVVQTMKTVSSNSVSSSSSLSELLETLDENGIRYPPTATRKELEQLLLLRHNNNDKAAAVATVVTQPLETAAAAAPAAQNKANHENDGRPLSNPTRGSTAEAAAASSQLPLRVLLEQLDAWNIRYPPTASRADLEMLYSSARAAMLEKDKEQQRQAMDRDNGVATRTTTRGSPTRTEKKEGDYSDSQPRRRRTSRMQVDSVDDADDRMPRQAAAQQRRRRQEDEDENISQQQQQQQQQSDWQESLLRQGQDAFAFYNENVFQSAVERAKRKARQVSRRAADFFAVDNDGIRNARYRYVHRYGPQQQPQQQQEEYNDGTTRRSTTRRTGTRRTNEFDHDPEPVVEVTAEPILDTDHEFQPRRRYRASPYDEYDEEDSYYQTSGRSPRPTPRAYVNDSDDYRTSDRRSARRPAAPRADDDDYRANGRNQRPSPPPPPRTTAAKEEDYVQYQQQEQRRRRRGYSPAAAASAARVPRRPSSPIPERPPSSFTTASRQNTTRRRPMPRPLPLLLPARGTSVDDVGTTSSATNANTNENVATGTTQTTTNSNNKSYARSRTTMKNRKIFAPFGQPFHDEKDDFEKDAFDRVGEFVADALDQFMWGRYDPDNDNKKTKQRQENSSTNNGPRQRRRKTKDGEPQHWKDRLEERFDYMLGIHRDGNEYNSWMELENEEQKFQGGTDAVSYAQGRSPKQQQRKGRRIYDKPFWEEEGNLFSLLIGRTKSGAQLRLEDTMRSGSLLGVFQTFGKFFLVLSSYLCRWASVGGALPQPVVVVSAATAAVCARPGRRLLTVAATFLVMRTVGELIHGTLSDTDGWDDIDNSDSRDKGGEGPNAKDDHEESWAGDGL